MICYSKELGYTVGECMERIYYCEECKASLPAADSWNDLFYKTCDLLECYGWNHIHGDMPLWIIEALLPYNECNWLE